MAELLMKNCIIYRSPRSNNERKIVVINGIPFYQSTGQNSGASGAWFPFIMVRGNKVINLDNLPEEWHQFFRIPLPENYMIKYSEPAIKADVQQEIYDGRIPTKETLVYPLA
jgi:hypothetical protein